MYCSAYASFRNPNYFERANECVVDRFLNANGGDGDVDNDTSELARLVMPFGSGQRVCIGQRYVAPRRICKSSSGRSCNRKCRWARVCVPGLRCSRRRSC